MEITEQIYNEIIKYLDIPYLLAFMAFGYMFKHLFLNIIVLITKKDLYKSKVVKNLIIFFIGTLIAIPFWYGFKHDKMILFVTFCVGTSIHDLIIKTLGMIYSSLVKKILNKDV